MFHFFRRNNKKDSVDNVPPPGDGTGVPQECKRPRDSSQNDTASSSNSNSGGGGQPTLPDADKNRALSERDTHHVPGQQPQYKTRGTISTPPPWLTKHNTINSNNSATTKGQQQQQQQLQGDTVSVQQGQTQYNNMAASRGNKGNKGKRKPVPYNRPQQQQQQQQQPQQQQQQQQAQRSSTNLVKQQQVQNTPVATTTTAGSGSDGAPVRQVQHCSGTSYANILKRLDEAAAAEPEKKRPTHSVKPCSHVTVAASPRPVPPPAKPAPGTPPPPPRKNSRSVMEATSSSSSGSSSAADTVTAAIKLRIDLPAIAQQHTSDNNNNSDSDGDGDGMSVNDSISGVISNTHTTSEQQHPPTITDDNTGDNKRNLVNQESRFQSQLAELTERLRVRETETSELRSQMEELQRDAYVKSSSVDRLQAELQAAHKESEFVRQKLKLLQEEIHTYKQKNIELVNDVQRKTDEYKTLEVSSKERTDKLETTVSELNAKLQGLETQLNGIREERDKLEEARNTLENERDEEKKIVQEALEVAEQEKEAIKKRWEEDFEKLRTVNTDREQQMLDDFEWKLREVQQSCKRRLDEKERQTLQRIEEMQRTVASKVQQADKQMNEVVHLKSYEAEVTQLRGLTNDQQHSLRTMSARVDELQAAEQTLQEEIGRLHMAVDLEKQQLAAQQRRHEKDLADKERALQIRLEKQRGEVAVQWEQKLRQECARLKAELEQLHAEEKHLAVELVKVQRDREFDTVKEQWQRKLEQHVKELAELKETLAKKEAKHQTEVERLQTNADRDIMELRRELDKAEMGYHERIEKMLEDHEQQLERLNEEADRRLKEAEQNCQMQVSSMRATLELVKEQMERETQDKLERLSDEHQSILDEQWQRLTDGKREEVQRIEHEYKCKFDKLKEQFTVVQKTHQRKETELLALVNELQASVQAKDTVIEQLQGNVDTLQGGVQVLNQEITNQDKQVTKIRTEAEQRIGELQHALKQDRDTLQRERQEHIERMAHVQKQSQAVIEQLQRKCQCLTKLFEEMRARYERRESRPEDLNVISDLRGVIAEQEKDLAVLNEEKRYYQMELLKRTNTNGNEPPAQTPVPTPTVVEQHGGKSIQINGHENDIETSCDLLD